MQLTPAAALGLAVDAHGAAREQRPGLPAGVDEPGQLEQLPQPDDVTADRDLARRLGPHRSPCARLRPRTNAEPGSTGLTPPAAGADARVMPAAGRLLVAVLLAACLAGALRASRPASAGPGTDRLAEVDGARYRMPGAASSGAGGRALPADVERAGLTFDPGVAPADRAAVLAAVAGARPEARRLIGLVDGLVDVSVGPAGPGAVGVTHVGGARYEMTLDLARVSAELGPRGVTRLVLHELGHVVDHALLPDELVARLDAGIPGGWGCEQGMTGACTDREERFAESFAKWASGDLGRGASPSATGSPRPVRRSRPGARRWPPSPPADAPPRRTGATVAPGCPRSSPPASPTRTRAATCSSRRLLQGRARATTRRSSASTASARARCCACSPASSRPTQRRASRSAAACSTCPRTPASTAAAPCASCCSPSRRRACAPPGDGDARGRARPGGRRRRARPGMRAGRGDRRRGRRSAATSSRASWDAACRRIVRSGLDEVGDRAATTLSGGERKRLVLDAAASPPTPTCCCSTSPTTSSTSPPSASSSAQSRATKKTILLISHDRELLTARVRRDRHARGQRRLGPRRVLRDLPARPASTARS